MRFDEDAGGYTRKPATGQETVLERATGTDAGVRAGHRPSIAIEHIRPDVDCGRYAVKRVLGDDVVVEADVFAHGHDELAVELQHRADGGRTWKSVAMEPLRNDRSRASFPVDRLGGYRFRIVAWFDDVATWSRDFTKKRDAGVDSDLDREEGARLAERAAKSAKSRDRAALESWAERLRAGVDDKTAASLDRLVAVARRAAERADAHVYEATSPVWVDRPLARCSAWYELFPRSASADPTRPGTLLDVAARVPYVAGMGFDVLYLPPIHPIGSTHRKGRNNAARARTDDPGSPWAIGGAEGGHTAVHPDLGTLADFDTLLTTARAHGVEVALDLAFQASPDHPWVREHPEWFRHRADGTIAYAENPPKRYEDIYPIDFHTEDREGLWAALLDVARTWVDRGVRVFRVDNPHTKPFEFWEWLIATVHDDHPDVLF